LVSRIVPEFLFARGGVSKIIDCYIGTGGHGRPLAVCPIGKGRGYVTSLAALPIKICHPWVAGNVWNFEWSFLLPRADTKVGIASG